jgi:hypothetical protein
VASAARTSATANSARPLRPTIRTGRPDASNWDRDPHPLARAWCSMRRSSSTPWRATSRKPLVTTSAPCTPPTALLDHDSQLLLGRDGHCCARGGPRRAARLRRSVEARSRPGTGPPPLLIGLDPISALDCEQLRRARARSAPDKNSLLARHRLAGGRQPGILTSPRRGQGFVTLRSEDRDSTCRPPTTWDALFGCVRAARVRVETAYRRSVTRERMAVLCRGSND